MESILRLGAGAKIEIPKRLLQTIESEPKADLDEWTDDQLERRWEGILSHPEDCSPGGIAAALAIARRRLEKQKVEEAVLLLGVYADKKARAYLEEGRLEEGLPLLADALRLQHGAFAQCSPNFTRPLANALARQAEECFRLSSLLGSMEALAARTDDITEALNVALTVWEPELDKKLRQFLHLLPQLVQSVSTPTVDKRNETRELKSQLTVLKKTLAGRQMGQARYYGRLTLLYDLAESWLEIGQQEVTLALNAEYASAGLDAESIERQARRLIGETERRLRLVISAHYRQQYGDSWMQHISARHGPMYEIWMRNQERDQASFKTYSEYSPQILEYARFEDLGELIIAQWHLFKHIFDFGYDKRNNSVFKDKISQIARVRNPLAHHRTVPENELLRARVLCTDILIALDRAGEGGEH